MISKDYLDAVKEIIKLNPERQVALNTDVDSILFIDGDMADFALPENCHYEDNKLIVNDKAYDIKNIKEMEEEELITGKKLEDMLSLSDTILEAFINDKNAKVEFTDAPEKATAKSLAKRIKLIPEDFKRFVEKNNFIKGHYDNKIRAKNHYDRALKEYDLEKDNFAVDFDDLKNRVNSGNLSLDDARVELQLLLEALSKSQASLTAMNVARAYYNEGSGKIKGLAIPKEGILGKRFNWYRHDLKKATMEKAEKLFMEYADALINFKDKDDTNFLERVEANMEAFSKVPTLVSDKIINGEDEISIEDVKKEMASKETLPKETTPAKEEVKPQAKSEDKKLSDYVFNVLKLYNKYDDLLGSDDPLIMAQKANVKEQINRAVREYLVDARHINIDEWVNLDDISLAIARDITKQTLENKRILEEKGLTVEGSDAGKLYHFNNDELEEAKRLKLFEAYPNPPYPSYAEENLNKWEKAAKYVEPEKTIEEISREKWLDSIQKTVEERVNFKMNLEKDKFRQLNLDNEIAASINNLDRLKDMNAKIIEFQKNASNPHAYDEIVNKYKQDLINEYKNLDTLYKERTAKHVVENDRKREVAYAETQAKEAELTKTELDYYKFFINDGRSKRGEDGFLVGYVDGDNGLDVAMLSYPEIVRLGSLYQNRDIVDMNNELEKLEENNISSINKEENRVNRERKKALNDQFKRLDKIDHLQREIEEIKNKANENINNERKSYKEEASNLHKEIREEKKKALKDQAKYLDNKKADKSFEDMQSEEKRSFEKAKELGSKEAFEDELINDKMLGFAFTEISRDEDAKIDNPFIDNHRKDDIILGRDKDNKVVFDYNGSIAKEDVLAEFREYYDTKYGVDKETAEEFASELNPQAKAAYMTSYKEYQRIKNEAKNKADQIYAHIINK